MTPCLAVCRIKNVNLTCALDAPHKGIAHTDEARQAAWCSHDEAAKVKRTPWKRTPRTEAEWDEWEASR